MPTQPKDYSQLKALLESQEKFPTTYLHKFIGKNTVAFHGGVSGLEKRFATLTLELSRESVGGKHVAKTYRFGASSADEIIELLKATDQVPDLLMVL